MGGRSARTTQKSRRAKKKVTLDEDGKVRLLNEFLAALKDNNQELAKEKLSLSYHRRNNFFVQLLLDQFFESLESNQVQSESALASIHDIAQLEQEISGDRFTLDLYNFLRSATPEKLAADKIARAKYLKAQQHYDSLQTAEAKTEALNLLTVAADEFEGLGDTNQALLAQHFKILLSGDAITAYAASVALEQEARTKNYYELLLRVKSQQMYLNGYKVANRLRDEKELVELANRINDQNFQFLISLKAKSNSRLEMFARGINLVTSKELENKDRQNIYSNLADDLLKTRQNTKFAAFESELEGSLLAITTNIRLVSAQGLRQLGLRYASLGDHEKAQAFFEKALADNERTILAPAMTALGKIAMAELSLKTKNYQDSKGYFEKVFRSAQGNLAISTTIGARINWAKALIRSREKEGAKQELSEIVSLLDSSKIEEKDIALLRESYKRIAVEYCLKIENDPQQALLVYAGEKSEKLNRSEQLSRDKIKSLQSKMKPDAQKIVFMVGDEETAAWVISTNRFEYFTIDSGKAELGGKIEKLLELLTAKSSEENQNKVEKLSQELYAIIIQPLEQSIKQGSHLLFFSDQSLGLLPYACLQKPGSGLYLVNEHQIQEIEKVDGSSGESFDASITATDKFLGISNPAFDSGQNPGLRSLESADLEVEKISGLFQNQLTLKGSNASLSQVVSNLKRAQIVHLSAHSIADAADPWNSRILLAKANGSDGESLNAATIRKMKLANIKFISLSSCSSVGLLGEDGNATGLARAFLEAGVPVVIASLWDIDSKQSSDFMVKFYNYFVAGNSPARALQLTQLDALKSSQMSGFSIGSAFVVISQN